MLEPKGTVVAIGFLAVFALLWVCTPGKEDNQPARVIDYGAKAVVFDTLWGIPWDSDQAQIEAWLQSRFGNRWSVARGFYSDDWGFDWVARGECFGIQDCIYGIDAAGYGLFRVGVFLPADGEEYSVEIRRVLSQCEETNIETGAAGSWSGTSRRGPGDIYDAMWFVNDVEMAKQIGFKSASYFQVLHMKKRGRR